MAVAVVVTVAAVSLIGVGSGPAGATSKAASKLGQGVTDSTIKLGLVQVDYSCIKDFVDFDRGDQEETYKVFVDDLNKHGGILGRKVEPVYRDFCPVGNAAGALHLHQLHGRRQGLRGRRCVHRPVG